MEETNRYANANTSTAPNARPWHDTTVPEMKAFVGMLIIMGIVVLPRLELYWMTTHPLIATSGIASVMSCLALDLNNCFDFFTLTIAAAKFQAENLDTTNCSKCDDY